MDEPRDIRLSEVSQSQPTRTVRFYLVDSTDERDPCRRGRGGRAVLGLGGGSVSTESVTLPPTGYRASDFSEDWMYIHSSVNVLTGTE